MARTGTPLDTGDRFPEMRVTLTDGNSIKLPDDLGSGYKVILIYRGQW
jgi:peroxiredoxin